MIDEQLHVQIQGMLKGWSDDLYQRNREIYDVRRGIATYVSPKFREQRRKMRLTQKQIANKLAEKTGLSDTTCNTLISEYERGYLITTSEAGEFHSADQHLNRLSLYIQELQFENDELEPIIKLMKIFHRKFIYPPTPSGRIHRNRTYTQ